MTTTTTNVFAPLSGLMLGVCLLAAASDAQAVTQTRTLVVNPASTCQSSLPVFDGNIRKRPKAVQNEGDSSAFVTCSYYSQSTADTLGNPRSVAVNFSTQSGAIILVSCTGVLGVEGTSFPTAVKQQLLPADGTTRTITWDAGDFGGVQGNPMSAGQFAFNCNLAPGVGIHNATITFIEDVGA